MTAAATIPNLFETNFNVYVKKSEQKISTVNDKPQINQHIVCRVDSRHFDKVMTYLAPIADLKKHNIKSRDDWVESLMEQVKNTITFDEQFKDHQCTLKLSGKNVVSFSNVELTTFQFEPQHTNLTFHLIAYDVKGDDCGKLIDKMGGNLNAVFKRAGHWSEQEKLPVTMGDGDKQQSIPDGEKK